MTSVDPLVLGIVGLFVAAGLLWVAALATKRTADMPIANGLLNGLIGSVVVLAVTVVVVTVLFNGQHGEFISLDLGGAFAIGVIVGVTIAGGFLLIGVALMPVGLLLRAGERWVTFGAWIAVPIVVASFGLADGAFNAGRQEPGPRLSAAGTASLQLSGQQLGRVTATGAATCVEGGDGSFTVSAGSGSTPGLTASNGQAAEFTLTIASDRSVVAVEITIGQWQAFPGKGWEPGGSTTILDPSWTRQAGRITLANLVSLNPQGEPDPSERWNGVLSWTCSL